jgi:hypothetical protein
MKCKFQSAIFFTTLLLGATTSLTGCATTSIDRNKGAEIDDHQN